MVDISDGLNRKNILQRHEEFQLKNSIELLYLNLKKSNLLPEGIDPTQTYEISLCRFFNQTEIILTNIRTKEIYRIPTSKCPLVDEMTNKIFNYTFNPRPSPSQESEYYEDKKYQNPEDKPQCPTQLKTFPEQTIPIPASSNIEKKTSQKQDDTSSVEFARNFEKSYTRLSSSLSEKLSHPIEEKPDYSEDKYPAEYVARLQENIKSLIEDKKKSIRLKQKNKRLSRRLKDTQQALTAYAKEREKLLNLKKKENNDLIQQKEQAIQKIQSLKTTFAEIEQTAEEFSEQYQKEIINLEKQLSEKSKELKMIESFAGESVEKYATEIESLKQEIEDLTKDRDYRLSRQNEVIENKDETIKTINHQLELLTMQLQEKEAIIRQKDLTIASVTKLKQIEIDQEAAQVFRDYQEYSINKFAQLKEKIEQKQETIEKIHRAKILVEETLLKEQHGSKNSEFRNNYIIELKNLVKEIKEQKAAILKHFNPTLLRKQINGITDNILPKETDENIKKELVSIRHFLSSILKNINFLNELLAKINSKINALQDEIEGAIA